MKKAISAITIIFLVIILLVLKNSFGEKIMAYEQSGFSSAFSNALREREKARKTGIPRYEMAGFSSAFSNALRGREQARGWSGDTPGPGPSPSGDTGGGDGDGRSSAEEIRQAALDAIGKRLEEVKRMAREHLERAGVLREGALGDVRDTTSMIKGNARQTAGDIEKKNRMAARALGRQGSSAYDQSLTNLNEGLGRTMGGINLDQAAGRRSIWDQYGEAESKAGALERSGMLDYGEDVNAANAMFASRLDAIEQANRMISALQGQYGEKGMADRQTQLFTGLQGLESFGTDTGQPAGQEYSNPYSMSDLASNLAEMRRKRMYGLA